MTRIRLGVPIPEACLKDPMWTGQLSDLANTLILLGAKPKLISRYTGLSPKTVGERYRQIGQTAPDGRLRLPQAKLFACNTNRGGLEFNVQAASFAGALLSIEKALPRPLNRGWLLAAAYLAYRRLNEPLVDANHELRQLDINQAYYLMSYVSGPTRKNAPLMLTEAPCEACGTRYLILAYAEPDSQHCPMCSINRRYQQLQENSRAIAYRRRAHAG